MKTSILTLLAAAGFAAAAFAAPVADATPEGEAKIISYNIRLGVADDGANSWEHRREATLRMLEREAPTVFGIQEGYLFQVKYIEENLPQYGRVGVGRDDGKEGGEIMAVFYLRDRYDLLDHGDLWLSETPDRVSRGWDGACNRTMTWVHLREKATGKEFYYFNTHLDHKGVVARREGVKLVVREVQQIAGRKAAVVVGGDLNSTIDDRIFDPLKKVHDAGAREGPRYRPQGNVQRLGAGAQLDGHRPPLRAQHEVPVVPHARRRLRRALYLGSLSHRDRRAAEIVGYGR